MKETTYYSSEFNECLTVLKRMKETVDVAIQPVDGNVRFHRMKRYNLAAYLKACGFKRTQLYKRRA
jgi:hypothetical protein